MSQEELGEKMFVSRQTVSQWETGQTTPSIDSLIKLHEIFGVSVDEILGISADENKASISEELKQEESYSFQFESKEVEKICSYAIKPFKKSLLLNVFFAVACFITMCTSKSAGVSIFFGVLFGIFLGYIIIYAKTIFNTNREWKKAALIIPSRIYNYSVSDGILTIKITEDENLISEDHKPIEEIKNITDAEGYYLLAIAGRSYIIRKADLKSDSKILLYMKSNNAVKVVPPNTARNWKTLSIIMVIASFASIYGGLMISTAMSEATDNAGDFTRYMWTMFLFLPIPIFSIVLGCILKRKGIKYKKNIIVGIIMCCLLCIYGSFTFIFSGMNDAISTVEQKMNIDIPEHESYSMTTSIYPKNRDTMKNFSACEISFSLDNTEKFCNSMDEKWVANFSDEFDEFIAVDEEKYKSDFCLLYNADTNEYNTVPVKNGEYSMILLLFSKSNGRLFIFQYQLTT